MCKYIILLTRLNFILFTFPSCAVHPVGLLLFHGVDPGTEILILRVFKFPGTFLRINFKCRVRLCDATTDFSCYEVSSQLTACRTFGTRFVIGTAEGVVGRGFRCRRSFVVFEGSQGTHCVTQMATNSRNPRRDCIFRRSHRLETFLCTCVAA